MKNSKKIVISACKIILTIFVVNSFSVSATPLNINRLKGMASNINNFGFDILKQSRIVYEKNDIISPISIYTALSISLSGAQGNTAEEIAKTLLIKNYKDKYHTEIRSYNEKITSILKGSENELFFANGLWVSERFPVFQTFKRNVQEDYGAEINNADFINNNENEKKKINQWIAGKTNNKIINMIQKVDPSTKLIIINAVYFKARWQYAFNESKTEIRTFYLKNNIEEEVLMMHQTFEKIPYYENELMKLVCIPYKDNTMEMVIILPKEYNSFESKLSNISINRWIDSTSHKKINLYLPKFKFENKYDLKNFLEKNGRMPSAFGKNANFTKINKSGSIYINEVIHHAVIDIDENGTEASAATDITITKLCERLELNNELEMKVDHPFYFIIRERNAGGYLFLGKVNNPNIK